MKKWWVERYQSPRDVAAYLESHRNDLDPKITKFEVDTYLEGISPFIQLERDAKILDGYCGNGRHALEMARRGFHNIIGFDYSFPMVNLAKQQAISEGLKGVSFVRMDARRLAFPSDYFVLYQTHNTSFIGFFDTDEENTMVVQEAYRVLQPGGILIFDLVDRGYALEKLASLHTEIKKDGFVIETDRETYIDETGRTFTEFTETHKSLSDSNSPITKLVRIRVYSEKEVTQLLQKAGFETIGFYPKAFNYDPEGKTMGTRGVRNLYIAQKPYASF